MTDTRTLLIERTYQAPAAAVFGGTYTEVEPPIRLAITWI